MPTVKSALTRLKVHFPRAATLVRRARPSVWRRQKRWEGMSTKEIFSTIYEENYWSNAESLSGAGSTLECTAAIRSTLPALLDEIGVRTLIDAPCGDFNWMKSVDLGVDHYIGADIVPALIKSLQATYGNASRSFRTLDLTQDPLPEADALLCRDCLQHLSNEQVHRVLENVRRSSLRYLIATTYPEVRHNTDGFTGGTNTINLCRPPFNLPEPARTLEDHGTGNVQRVLGLWEHERLGTAS